MIKLTTNHGVIALELNAEKAPKTVANFVAYENLGDLYAKLASQAYARAVQIDAGSRTAKAKLALAHDLIAAPAGKPAAAVDGNGKPGR